MEVLLKIEEYQELLFCGLGLSKMFDLNLSPSHCDTSHALQNINTNVLHDAWVSLDDNDYTSSYSTNSDSNTSDSASDNESLDNDDLNMMNGNLKKYPNVNLFMPKSYFTFNKACYDLMVDDILGVRKITIDLLRHAKNGVVVDLRLWKSMKQRISLMGDREIYLKESPNLRIPYIEQWEDIVTNAHVKASHLGLKDTLDEIKKGWSVDARYHGLSKVYVKAYVDACGCQKVQKAMPLDMLDHTSSAPSEKFVVEESMLSVVLDDIQIKYSTCLKKCKTKNKYHERYVCHRWGESKRGSKYIRRCKTTKRCGCTFYVDIKRSIGDRKQVSISVYAQHKGHDPGAPHEVYYLKVHPNVIHCCMEDLFDVGCARHVARISMRKAIIHKNKVTHVERVIFRFFMLTKEVQNIASKLNVKKSIAVDDWTRMIREAYALKDQGKVAYIQPYIPTKQPFVLIIQDQWMLNMCMRLSKNNAWAIDSTFKTNVFGLPLYAAVAPNEQGVGIPLWYMLCTNDAGYHHEQLALEMTLKKIFERMKGIRPNALVIDKCWVEYIALKNVITSDPYCWEMVNDIRQQTVCKILLCWFHVKKAWVDHLLLKVHGKERDKLYARMCQLMYASKEEEFDHVYAEILEEYNEQKLVCNYIKNCWCNDIWRNTWPKFGRMFEYGHVDTTKYCREALAIHKVHCIQRKNKSVYN